MYDTDATGTGRLMSVTPYTAAGLQDRRRAAGHDHTRADRVDGPGRAPRHLVIDTVDPRWHAAEPAGSTITLSSTAAAPASLRVPTG